MFHMWYMQSEPQTTYIFFFVILGRVDECMNDKRIADDTCRMSQKKDVCRVM